MKSNAVVLFGKMFLYCEEAIGGEYYHVIGDFHSLNNAVKLMRDKRPSRVSVQHPSVIVRLNDASWLITQAEGEDGVRPVLCTCKNLERVKIMRDA